MRSIASVLLLLSSFTPAIAAQSQAAPVAQASVSTVSAPHLVTFSGSVHEPSAVKAGVAGVTFAIYKNQQGGAALWMETQNVKLDPSGRYTVSLGATKPTGLPVELFVSGEAQWLGITVAGQPEQDRVLLLSVPYALKAADAETIGGLAPSAFVLAAPLNGTALSTAATTSPTAPVGTVTGSGTQNFVPLWTNSTGLLGNSVLFQSGTGSTAAIGINTTTPVGTLDVKGSATVRGTLNLPATGSATATAGKNSQPQIFTASSFNSGTKAAVNTVDLGVGGYFLNNSASSPTVAAENKGATAASEVFLAIGPTGYCYFTGNGSLTCTGTINHIASLDGGARKVATLPSSPRRTGSRIRVKRR